jgi:hypothetical protein
MSTEGQVTQLISMPDDRADRIDAPAPANGAGPARVTKERTVQVSLRLPANWVKMLRQRALTVAAAEDAIITPQEVVRRMIAQALNIKV